MPRLRHLLVVACPLGFLALLVLWAGFWRTSDAPQVHAQQTRGAAVAPLAMPRNLTAVEIRFRLGENTRLPWSGKLAVTQGQLVATENLSAARLLELDGDEFRILDAGSAKKAKKKKKKAVAAQRPALSATLAVEEGTVLTIDTPAGPARVALAQLPVGATRRFLNGQVQVTRGDAALRLTGPDTEDDHPAIARGKDDSAWLAYVAYQPGQAIDMQQVVRRQFETLVPQQHGDQILLRRFSSDRWERPIEVTEAGVDVWRPTIAVDGQGRVHIAWAQKIDDHWQIVARTYTPGSDGGQGSWSGVQQLTNDEGSDFNVVSAADSRGNVWLAWQAFRDGNFTILAAQLGQRSTEPLNIGLPDTNNWTPSITADGQGNVYVAWDHYAKDNYDVELATINSGQSKSMPVAQSARFEARPHVVCDDQDRVWLAYEEGDEQWGKDYQGNTPERVGLPGNPGSGLYVNRTLRVKCLEDGELREPASDLQQALAEQTPRGRSVARLAVADGQGPWLLLRHHLTEQGGGEAWVSYALQLDGQQWSTPRQVPHSSNLIDNRPALLADDQGLLAVYSSDSRTRTQDRQQCDLFATRLASAGTTSAPELQAADDAPEATVEPVHPHEKAAIARMRAFELETDGGGLQLLRGEFHRHTEYTAHRDQDGLLEDSLRYALDAGGLDWMGNGDHDNGFGDEYLWWQIQKIFDLYHNPPHFIAAMTYERSVVFPSGHRNVMFPDRGVRPLPRMDGRDNMFGTAEEGAPDIKLLYDYLKHFDGICAIHTSGTNMGTDWRDNDPDVEPIVEIYQGHRHNYEHFGAPRAPTEQTQIGGYQPDGFVWNALEKGYRLGFQSSSDHVSTHMSYAVVLVDDVSRQGIIDAFKKRHCYGATDNILLVVRSGPHLMGDEFETSDRPTLDIVVHGSAPLARVHVVRDNNYVYTAEPNQQEVTLQFTDRDAQRGQTYYYYVRVDQQDGNVAWASPMWITYR